MSMTNDDKCVNEDCPGVCGYCCDGILIDEIIRVEPKARLKVEAKLTSEAILKLFPWLAKDGDGDDQR